MAQRSASRQATETLQEIESVFDRLARWVAENPRQLLGALAAILIVIAGVRGARTGNRSNPR